MRGHGLEVLSLALSADGKRLFSGSGDNTIKVWDLEAGKETLTLRGHDSAVTSLALAADGKRLFSGSEDSTIKVWNLETGKEIRTLRGHTRAVRSLVLSGDGKRLFSGSGDNTIKVWDLETGKEARTLPGLTGRVVSLALSGDGKRLFLGRGLDMKLTGDGRRMILPADGGIKVWDLEAGKEILTLRGHTGDVRSLALERRRQAALFGQRLQPWRPRAAADDTIKAWDLETGKEIVTLRGHSGWVLRLIPTSDGKRLISSSGDGTIKVWDLETRKATHTLRSQATGDIFTGQFLPIALSGDGTRLFSGGDDKKITVWDLATGKKRAAWHGHTGAVLSLALTHVTASASIRAAATGPSRHGTRRQARKSAH